MCNHLTKAINLCAIFSNFESIFYLHVLACFLLPQSYFCKTKTTLLTIVYWPSDRMT